MKAKRVLQRVLGIVLSLVMLVAGVSDNTAITVAGEGRESSRYKVGDAVYEYDTSTQECALVDYDEYVGGVAEIPSGVTIDGVIYQVTGIGDGAFQWCDGLTEIRIPSGVTSIGSEAFYDCSSLGEIRIPSGVTSIGSSAFYGCSSLGEITIPSGVTSIEAWTFEDCSSLIEITIPSGVTSIGSGAFQECSSLTEITIPSEVTSIGSSAFYGCSSLGEITIPSGVTSIEAWTFEDCSSLIEITIPSGVTSIEKRAFEGCSSLIEITIPSRVESIGYAAFIECNSLKEIVVEGNNPIYDSRDNCNAIIETATNTLVAGCKTTKIPSGVTSIGSSAFQGCSALTEVNIPSGVTGIGYAAFWKCSSLKKVNIPSSVTSMDDTGWFSECSDLEEIVVSEDNPVYDSRNNCNAIIETATNTLLSGCKTTKIPSGVTSIDYNAFYGCTGLKEISIPPSVASVRPNAFLDCTGLEEISIPSGVTSIGWGVFEGCSSLREITIPSSVTSIEEHAFLGCSVLARITVSESNSVYDSRNNCNAIIETATNTLLFGCKTTKIPSGVTSINWSAFEGCSSLTEITIPSSVTSIEGAAFRGCSRLRKITIPSGVTSIKSCAFLGCTELEEISIPSSVTSIGNEAFGSCSSLEEITIPSGVTSIERGTFEGCSSLEEITIPTGVTSIERGTFEGCSSLAKITIPSSVTSIEGAAFQGCDNLTIYCGEGSVAATYAQKRRIPYVTGDTPISTNTPTQHPIKSYDIDSLTYSFSNNRQAFGYSSSYKIPYNSYKLIFGDTVRAQYYYNNKGIWSGSCYGMTSTSGMFNYPELNVKDFNGRAVKLQDLKVTDANKDGMTVRALIETMQVSALDTPIQSQFQETTNDLEGLCSQVKDVKDTGKPVLIAVWGPDENGERSGHAVLGYGIEKISNTQMHLNVYDCNFPGQNRYITLSTDSDGKITGWYYYLNDRYHWGNQYENCKINYISYDIYSSEWENRTLKQNNKASGQNNNVLFLNCKNAAIYNDNNKLVATLEEGILYTDYKDIFMIERMEISADNIDAGQSVAMICLPTAKYTIKNKDADTSKELQVSMVGINRGATVSTSSDEVTFDIDDTGERNDVSVKTSDKDTYNIVLDSTAGNDNEQIEVTGIGNNTVVSVSQLKGNLSLGNCIGASVLVNGQYVSGLTEPKESLSPVPMVSDAPTSMLGKDNSSLDKEPSDITTTVPNADETEDEEKVGNAKIQKAKKLKGRKVKLILKRVKNAEGYQIVYSTNKKFNNRRKKNTAMATIIIKNLKKGKTYYFKIRAYRFVNGERVYGRWSSIKKIRVKK